jgi:signal transduction histidine kinase
VNGDPDLITSLVQALSHPFYVIDIDTYVVKLANAAAYAGPLPAGITCHALTHHQDMPCDRLGEVCPVSEIRRSKQPLSIEHLHYDAEGHCTALEVHAFPILNAEGRLTGIIEYTLDITERKETERLKDEFIAMVSHELRTPLNHIKGYATTLLQTDVVWDTATQQDFISRISHEADRLSDLVEKILDLSRLEARPLSVEREWYQVADLVDAALQRRRGLLAGRPVELALDPDLPALFVDGQEIELVLTNLIENAAKYSPEGTPIRIRAERRADQVVLSVADQGVGIPEEQQRRIFERFYRVPCAGPRPPGTGLGLAICRLIVQAHRGRIWVASVPGAGSCFYFGLPVDGPAG